MTDRGVHRNRRDRHSREISRRGRGLAAYGPRMDHSAAEYIAAARAALADAENELEAM